MTTKKKSKLKTSSKKKITKRKKIQKKKIEESSRDDNVCTYRIGCTCVSCVNQYVDPYATITIGNYTYRRV